MSLRTKLTLAFLLVSLIGAGATGAALITGAYQAEMEQIGEKELLLVQSRAHNLEADLELISNELVRLSAQAEVDLADNDLEPEKRVLRFARKDSRLFHMRILLLDEHGQLLWEEPSGASVSRNFGPSPWFQRLRTVAAEGAGAPEVDELPPREPGAPHVLRVAVPILRHEVFSGALVGLLEPERQPALGRDVQLDLASAGTAALIGSDRSVIFSQGDSSSLVAIADSDPAQSAINGISGRRWIPDNRGRIWLLAYAPVPLAHWGVVMRQARDELDENLIHQIGIFGLVLASGMLLALGVGLSLARVITRPLHRLGEQAQSIADGHFGGVPPPPPGHDEVATLESAFYQMDQAILVRDREIREAAATLEAKVKARTDELHKMQDALLVSNRQAAMGQTAGAIAHELKNALNGLGLAIDLLTSGDVPREAANTIRSQVREEVARLRDISDNLNLFGGAPHLAMSPTDLHAVVERSLIALGPIIAHAGVEVQRELAGGGAPLLLSCDRLKVQTTLLNLCKNGIEAMTPTSLTEQPDGVRRLTVRSRVEGTNVVCEVEDTGSGLSAEASRHLYEPFFTTKRTGTGLGLAIAHKVVEAHGGTLTALPGSHGGTLFRIVLPRGLADIRTAPSSQPMATQESLRP
jgi:signal transduction histidine kinase